MAECEILNLCLKVTTNSKDKDAFTLVSPKTSPTLSSEAVAWHHNCFLFNTSWTAPSPLTYLMPNKHSSTALPSLSPIHLNPKAEEPPQSTSLYLALPITPSLAPYCLSLK